MDEKLKKLRDLLYNLDLSEHIEKHLEDAGMCKEDSILIKVKKAKQVVLDKITALTGMT